MMVYRSEERSVCTADLLAGIESLFGETKGRARPDHSLIRELLIAYGEFESAILDSLMPVRDERTAESDVLRNAALACGRWFYRSWRGEDCGPVSLRFGSALAAVRGRCLPARVSTSVPEGYAYYGLFPESYAQAAEKYVGNRGRACVIGIRGIGTSLSAAVAGALLENGVEVQSFTVRPHGHPFDRVVRLGPSLSAGLSGIAGSGSVLITDEGPGLSGSSFMAAAREVREAGVPRERIALFPSWEPDGAHFVNEGARAEWPRYAKYRGDFEPFLTAEPLQDLSAGRWRQVVPQSGPGIASQPQHEARKLLTPDGRLYKFSGLGRFGREKWKVARTLAGAGYSPQVLELRDGFIAFAFVAGCPMSRAAVTSPFLDHLASYIAYRTLHLPSSERSVSFDRMLAMIARNAGYDLRGRDSLEAGLEAFRSEFEQRPTVDIDGRMMPHEWLTTANGWLKADSVDHSRDHFYPGYADPAWDLAAASVEFRMTPDQKQQVLRRYGQASGDRVSPRILDFYEVAYLAFRLGYATLAASATTGTADHDRFGALQIGYRRGLDERLASRTNARRVFA